MKRPWIFAVNPPLGVAFATLYTFLAAWRGFDAPALEAAFEVSWWAGLLVGLAIGAGATFGPRPPLGWKKCVTAQAGVVVSSAIFALLWFLLPKEMTEIDRAVETELTRRGIQASSGIGAAVGTAIQMVQVYFTRRRAAARAKSGGS